MRESQGIMVPVLYICGKIDGKIFIQLQVKIRGEADMQNLEIYKKMLSEFSRAYILNWGDALGLWDIAKFKIIGMTQIEFFL